MPAPAGLVPNVYPQPGPQPVPRAGGHPGAPPAPYPMPYPQAPGRSMTWLWWLLGLLVLGAGFGALVAVLVS